MKKQKRSAQVISEEEGPHLKCTCLWGSGGLPGGIFFIVLLFVTPLKMYMGITSKLNKKEKKEHTLWPYVEQSAT